MHNEAEKGQTASHTGIFHTRDIHGLQSSIDIPVTTRKIYSTKKRFASQNILLQVIPHLLSKTIITLLQYLSKITRWRTVFLGTPIAVVMIREVDNLFES
jgi:hypothetical protein